VVYFKKYDPRIQLRTGAGSTVPFEDLGGQWGTLATNDNYVISELRKCQREARGGVMEVTEAEYLELKKKENQTFFPIWRETVGRQQILRLRSGVLARSVAEGKPLPFSPTGFSEAKAVAKPMVVSDFVPKTVKRRL
jgi:hypothetical protein